MPYIVIVHVPDHTPDAVIDQQHTLEQIYGSRLVGIFEYPGRSDLKCTGGCVAKHTGSWVRDPRGFIKCAICGSRNKRTRRWLIGHLFDLLGANLYRDAPAAFRTPEGYNNSHADND